MGDREGEDAYECADGADNDEDASFDCDDTGCTGSPDCQGDTGTDTETSGDTASTDEDGDGLSEAEGDCDPEDREVATGLTEVCDGKDNRTAAKMGSTSTATASTVWTARPSPTTPSWTAWSRATATWARA